MKAKTIPKAVLFMIVLVAMLSTSCGKYNNRITTTGQWKEESPTSENVVDTYTDIHEDSIKSVLKGGLGIDLSEYIESSDGVMRGSIYYVHIKIPEEAEVKFIQVIKNLCGEGVKASSRKKTILNNRLSENFKKAELLTVYDFLQEGTNGAKTTSATIYTSKSDGSMSVFIFGSK